MPHSNEERHYPDDAYDPGASEEAKRNTRDFERMADEAWDRCPELRTAVERRRQRLKEQAA